MIRARARRRVERNPKRDGAVAVVLGAPHLVERAHAVGIGERLGPAVRPGPEVRRPSIGHHGLGHHGVGTRIDGGVRRDRLIPEARGRVQRWNRSLLGRRDDGQPPGVDQLAVPVQRANLVGEGGGWPQEIVRVRNGLAEVDGEGIDRPPVAEDLHVGGAIGRHDGQPHRPRIRGAHTNLRGRPRGRPGAARRTQQRRHDRRNLAAHSGLVASAGFRNWTDPLPPPGGPMA